MAIATTWELGRRLRAPAGLAELGLAEAELDRAAGLAADRVAQTPRPSGSSGVPGPAGAGGHPWPPGAAELRALLDDAWRGHRPSPA